MTISKFAKQGPARYDVMVARDVRGAAAWRAIAVRLESLAVAYDIRRDARAIAVRDRADDARARARRAELSCR